MSKYTIIHKQFPEDIYNLIMAFDGGIKNDFMPIIKEMNDINYSNRVKNKIISVDQKFSNDYNIIGNLYDYILYRTTFKSFNIWTAKDNLIIEYNIYDPNIQGYTIEDLENGIPTGDYFTYTNESNYNKFFFDPKINSDILLKSDYPDDWSDCNYESD